MKYLFYMLLIFNPTPHGLCGVSLAVHRIPQPSSFVISFGVGSFWSQFYLLQKIVILLINSKNPKPNPRSQENLDRDRHCQKGGKSGTMSRHVLRDKLVQYESEGASSEHVSTEVLHDRSCFLEM